MCSGGGRKKRNKRAARQRAQQEAAMRAAQQQAAAQQRQLQAQLNAQAAQARELANRPVPQAPEPLQSPDSRSGIKKRKSKADKTGRRSLGTQQFSRPLNLGGYTGSRGGAPNV